ncbi:MAG TPA: hypothetical protein VF894_01720 [Anaeromyxobacter sp.]
MRTPRVLLAAAVLAAASPAAAQLSNRSIAVESGLSAPIDGERGPSAALALAATAWLDADLEAVARVAFGAAPETGGRGLDGAVTGTAGLRLSLLPEPLRPQVSLELGWARVDRPSGTADRLAFGAVVGIEWFPARDLSASARAALRGVGGSLSTELVLGLAAYF